MATWMLVDGNSLTYRAFFALPTDLMTASGQVTNAVYGFTSMLVNLVRDHRPDHVVVAFDRPEPTFRHEQVETYKANREAAPDILYQQMGLVRQVVDVLGLPVVEVAGYEADDVIATLAASASASGDDVLVVTGDRDAYQLVADPHVKVLYNKRGVSDYVLYDEAGIAERTGVTPGRYVEYAALRGDPSDNLPGVPGVGEKTAAKLINAYGGIDGIYEHLDEQTPKLRQNLAANEDQVRTNASLMRLVRDVPLPVALADLHPAAADVEAVRSLYDFLEFHTLLDRTAEAFALDALGAAAGETGRGAGGQLELDVVEVDADALAAELDAGTGANLGLAAAWSGDPGRSAIDALALVDGDAADRAVVVPGELLASPAVASSLAAALGAGGRPVVAHDAKALMRALHEVGVELRSLVLDTKIAAYLIDPAESRYALEDLAARYLGVAVGGTASGAEGQLDLDGTATERRVVAAEEAAATVRLASPLREVLDARGLRHLNDDVEVPLVRVLADMEIVGIGVDVEVLRELNDRMVAECDALTREIWEDAGVEFNVNSTPKLREVLYERLGLTPQKKTKTGYSTDAQSLERLRGEHPIIEHLLRYREVEKLRSTYGQGLLDAVGPDGRIHATFNQTVARTGRLSSDAPNLHNIPVRSEEGRAFRAAFVPAPGHRLLVADYNQIELRCIAHLAEDPGLIAAFESGQDIHRATAARVFGVAPTEVTHEQRSRAKMVSYGLAYGMEAYGLGQRLAIPTGEAQEILDAYFEAFPAVRSYMERTVAEARERGYTETLFGRRRQIPELSSGNYRLRQAGERQAMNAGIQGLAADIFKVALVAIDRALRAEGASSRLVLQVHDEVLVEVPEGEEELARRVVLDAMTGAFEMRVPLEVDIALGDSWAAAKG